MTLGVNFYLPSAIWLSHLFTFAHAWWQTEHKLIQKKLSTIQHILSNITFLQMPESKCNTSKRVLKISFFLKKKRPTLLHANSHLHTNWCCIKNLLQICIIEVIFFSYSLQHGSKQCYKIQPIQCKLVLNNTESFKVFIKVCISVTNPPIFSSKTLQWNIYFSSIKTS